MAASSHVQVRKLAFCGLVAAVLVGCGKGEKAAPIVAVDAFPFVQCKVVMGGKDVAGAIVTFHREGDKEKIVGAFDSESDVYRFVTSIDGKKKAGVPEGDYNVSVKPGKGSKTKIPEKYADPKRSGLAAKVVKGENFLPPFELTP
jgi:hypothetical protein